MQFIYTASGPSAEKLEAFGYSLLKHDQHSGIWVFVNDGHLVFGDDPIRYFADRGVECVLADTLTF